MRISVRFESVLIYFRVAQSALVCGSLRFLLTYFFAPVPSDSLVVLLYGSLLQHWIAVTFSITHGQARGTLFEIHDRYMYLHCTHVKFNCKHSRSMYTYVPWNGSCTVHSPSVRGPFKVRLIVVCSISVQSPFNSRLFNIRSKSVQ